MFDILYGEGISRLSEMVDLAVEMEIVNKSGSWFSMGDERIGQGRDSVKQYFIDNPEIADSVEEQIRAKLYERQASRTKVPIKAAAKDILVYSFLGYNDIQEGDVIEALQIVEIKRTL